MNSITSTMAGIVLRILVSEGDQIEEGQEVVVLESMKMEVPVTATCSGKVVGIKAETGAFVSDGEALLEVEG